PELVRNRELEGLAAQVQKRGADRADGETVAEIRPPEHVPELAEIAGVLADEEGLELLVDHRPEGGPGRGGFAPADEAVVAGELDQQRGPLGVEARGDA